MYPEEKSPPKNESIQQINNHYSKEFNSWSHFFADQASNCLKHGLLDDALKCVDIALTEKYLELLHKMTKKIKEKRKKLNVNLKNTEQVYLVKVNKSKSDDRLKSKL